MKPIEHHGYTKLLTGSCCTTRINCKKHLSSSKQSAHSPWFALTVHTHQIPTTPNPGAPAGPMTSIDGYTILVTGSESAPEALSSISVATTSNTDCIPQESGGKPAAAAAGAAAGCGDSPTGSASNKSEGDIDHDDGNVVKVSSENESYLKKEAPISRNKRRRVDVPLVKDSTSIAGYDSSSGSTFVPAGSAYAVAEVAVSHGQNAESDLCGSPPEMSNHSNSNNNSNNNNNNNNGKGEDEGKKPQNQQELETRQEEGGESEAEDVNANRTHDGEEQHMTAESYAIDRRRYHQASQPGARSDEVQSRHRPLPSPAAAAAAAAAISQQTNSTTAAGHIKDQKQDPKKPEKIDEKEEEERQPPRKREGGGGGGGGGGRTARLNYACFCFRRQ